MPVMSRSKYQSVLTTQSRFFKNVSGHAGRIEKFTDNMPANKVQIHPPHNHPRNSQLLHQRAQNTLLAVYSSLWSLYVGSSFTYHSCTQPKTWYRILAPTQNSTRKPRNVWQGVRQCAGPKVTIKAWFIFLKVKNITPPTTKKEDVEHSHTSLTDWLWPAFPSSKKDTMAEGMSKPRCASGGCSKTVRKSLL